jgi:hypothetical protein
MKLLRRLAMQFNILFKAVHIPGMLNTLADKLSLLQLKDIERQVPYVCCSKDLPKSLKQQ